MAARLPDAGYVVMAAALYSNSALQSTLTILARCTPSSSDSPSVSRKNVNKMASSATVLKCDRPVHLGEKSIIPPTSHVHAGPDRSSSLTN